MNLFQKLKFRHSPLLAKYRQAATVMMPARRICRLHVLLYPGEYRACSITTRLSNKPVYPITASAIGDQGPVSPLLFS
jgi:hypothetical protein